MIRLLLSLVLFSGLSGTAVGAIVLGNPQGKVTVTEVMDYQCLHCHRMQPLMAALEANPALKIRLIPTAILTRASIMQASAAYVVATDAPDKFMQYNNQLLAFAHTEKQTMALLKKWHLNTKQARQAMHSLPVWRSVATGLQLLKQYQSGTPLLLVYPTAHPEKVQVFRGETAAGQLMQAIAEAAHA